MAAYTTIDNPELFYQTVLYTGNDTGRTITLPGDEDMAPDLVWVKNRANADWPRVANSVVGVGKQLASGNNNSEDTNADGFTGFVSTGFQLGVDGSNIGVNETGETHVAFCWKAGGSTASNSTGDITTTVSVDTTAKFSIFTYTGTNVDGDTIGHSIGSVPHFWFIKRRSAAADWAVYHHKNTAAPETDYLLLSTTGATVDSTWWSDTAPTSTLITLGNPAAVNQGNTDTFVGFAWSEVQGYSKFGSFTGNGNADGPFAYLGFRPAWLMIKGTTTSGGAWHIYNNKIQGYNIENHFVEADATTVEADDDNLDLLSNGFKIRRHTGSLNTSGDVYVYVAFAEAPFVNSEGVAGTAR